MTETNDLKKNYFLHFIKGTSVILYIEDYHVSEIVREPEYNFAIGLSKNYQRIRFYYIDKLKGEVDPKRFVHINYSDYYLTDECLVNLKLPKLKTPG